MVEEHYTLHPYTPTGAVGGGGGGGAGGTGGEPVFKSRKRWYMVELE